MKILRSGMQRSRSKQHNVTPPLRKTRKFSEGLLEHQAEVEAEFHDEEAKAAELKNEVQTAKKSQEEE